MFPKKAWTEGNSQEEEEFDMVLWRTEPVSGAEMFGATVCDRKGDVNTELEAKLSWKICQGPGVARRILLQVRESLSCHWKWVWGNDSPARTQWEGRVIYEPFNLIVDI